MKSFNRKSNYVRCFCCVLSLLFLTLNLEAQKVIEPGKVKQFNITVNNEACTIKTQMLSSKKDFKADPNLTYIWYTSQKLIETNGGYDGKLIHGFYKVFYLSNQLKEEGTVKYGLKHKVWKSWYPDGKLRELLTWKNGVKSGEYILYNEKGEMMAKGQFKNNKLHGKFYTYGVGGRILEKKKYKHGDEVIPKPIVKKEKKPKKIKNKKIEETDKPIKDKKLKKKKIDSEKKEDVKTIQS